VLLWLASNGDDDDDDDDDVKWIKNLPQQKEKKAENTFRVSSSQIFRVLKVV